MKIKYLLCIFLLITLVLITAGFKKERAPFLNTARYMATCSLCKCLCVVSAQEVSLIRDYRQPACFFCSECKKVRRDLK